MRRIDNFDSIHNNQNQLSVAPNRVEDNVKGDENEDDRSERTT